MNSCIPRQLLLTPAVVILLTPAVVILVLTGASGCAEDRDRSASHQDGPALDWDSPRMCAIEKEWEALRAAHNRVFDGGKIEYEKYLQSVDRLFQKRLPARRLRELTASAKLPPVPEEQDTFSYSILTYMVKAFVESGDRQGLVELLAKRCPGLIEWPEYLEYWLAFRGKRLKDPILVLGEAFAMCRVPETRHALAAAARRGFAGQGIRGKDDAEFVRNAMQWYAKEKGHLTVNDAYIFNATSNEGQFTIESYESHPEYYDNPPRARDPLFQ